MIPKSTLTDTLERLKRIKAKAIDPKTRNQLGHYGICKALCNAIDNGAQVDAFMFYIAQWPDKDISTIGYPIPSGDCRISARDIYAVADNEEMWNPERPYGAKRHGGMDYVIERITQDLRQFNVIIAE